MRLFPGLKSAALEVRRDVFSGQHIHGTRVQQMQGDYDFVERLGYAYSISGNQEGWPADEEGLIELGKELGFDYFIRYPEEMLGWLKTEKDLRLLGNAGNPTRLAENMHPALVKTYEGSWPSYTYADRLKGAIDAMVNALVAAPDTRRAFWPIFRLEDALRASAPTRVPCSLGYQALIRKTDLDYQLYLFYLERSADFDHFWLSDVWLARQFQIELTKQVKFYLPQEVSDNLNVGPFCHQLISFHSFEVLKTEVY